jgi:PAS domain S-box-containing protein
LEGRGLIKDVFGDSIAYYSVVIPRDIHLQGIEGAKYLTSFLIGISVTFFVFVLLFLTKFVLAPIKNIAKSVNLIANTKDIGSRIAFSGNDEFGSLSRDINLMLDSLKSSNEKAYSEAEKSKGFFDVVSGIVVVIDKNGDVTTVNKKGAGFLGYEVSEVLGKNWVNNFVPENERESVNSIFTSLIGSKETKDDSYHENNVLLKTGGVALIGWRNSLLKDQNGEVVATVSHGEDITIKKQEQEKDKKQMEEYERLNQLMMGRELKMVELKKEIERLKGVT